MFSNEQYFDSNGLFISIMFSVPLILNSSLIVVSLLSFRIQFTKASEFYSNF